MRATTVRSGVAAVALVAAFLAGCSSGSSGGDESSTTAATSTTDASSTTVTKPAGSTTTTAAGSNGLEPGDACSLEEGSVDCIDPEGDGTGIYLIDGAACLTTHPDPSMCADLDGDGVAGYPDSE